jgi:hypothetical protein
MSNISQKLKALREMYVILKNYNDELSALRKKIRVHLSVNADNDDDWQNTWEGMSENIASMGEGLNSYVKSIKEELDLLTKSCRALEALEEGEAKETFGLFLTQHMTLVNKETRMGCYDYDEMMRTIAVTQKLLDEST